MVSLTLQAILIAAAMLGVGAILRSHVRLLRTLYVPAAVVAGGLGLVAVQATPLVSTNVATFGASLAGEWSTWPGLLIAVVFAGLLLETPAPGGFGAALRRGVRSATLAWIIILGQIAIGLIVYLIAVRPGRPGVPATFGQLLEVSWAGGHGSAAGMGAMYAQQGFVEGRDLAFFLATVGLVYGVLSGLLFVNIAVRRGWTASSGEAKTQVLPSGWLDAHSKTTASSAVIEPLAVQVIVLALAFGVGVLLRQAFLMIAALVIAANVDADRGQAIDAVANVPLFLFTLLGGSVLRRGLGAIGLGHVIDAAAVGRIVGVAMEFLIVAGVASMRLESLSQFGWPVALLLIGAAAWSAVCLLVLARQMLPPAYWFELGLLNYGFSTANTPQGMMLLRIVDPHLRSGAAADYAVAAPLSAPFVGGGVVTFLVLPLLLNRLGAGAVLAGVVAVMAVLYVLGRRLAVAATSRHEPRP